MASSLNRSLFIFVTKILAVPALDVYKRQVQYLCHITSTRWGCFLGLETVCDLSVYGKQTSKIISKITWIIDRSSFCQCDC